MEDPEDNSEEDHADYLADGGDDDDEPSDDDDDDTDDEDEEPYKDEDDDDEEEDHLAPTDSSVVPVIDPFPLAGDTEAFETDESAPTPRSPQTKVPFAQTRLRKARKTIRLEPPMSPSMEIPLSPLLLLPVLLSMPPPVDRREDVPEVELPPRKRLCPIAPTSKYKVGESLTAAPRPTGESRGSGYGIRDTWVDLREAFEEVASATLKGVNTRVSELATVQEKDTQDIYAMIEDTQDKQT
ncbi:hypothetical protein Tco_1293176 [Tanacetum coccineum]